MPDDVSEDDARKRLEELLEIWSRQARLEGKLFAPIAVILLMAAFASVPRFGADILFAVALGVPLLIEGLCRVTLRRRLPVGMDDEARTVIDSMNRPADVGVVAWAALKPRLARAAYRKVDELLPQVTAQDAATLSPGDAAALAALLGSSGWRPFRRFPRERQLQLIRVLRHTSSADAAATLHNLNSPIVGPLIWVSGAARRAARAVAPSR